MDIVMHNSLLRITNLFCLITIPKLGNAPKFWMHVYKRIRKNECLSLRLWKRSYLVEPAEIASININTAYWYLQLLGVYNPKKPDQIGEVFDFSAEHFLKQGSEVWTILDSQVI